MNVGQTRGDGGLGLYVHWTKAKNEAVTPLPARNMGAADLRAQVEALTAETGHATFQKPVLHMWFPPNPADRKPTRAELDDLLARVERELHLEGQPRIGVEHQLTRDVETAAVERHHSWGGVDVHEHYAWSLTAENGRAVDHVKLGHQRIARIVAEWQHDHGFDLTKSVHALAVLAWADEHRPEVATWMRAGGAGTGPRPVALYRSLERSKMERAAPEVAKAKTKHAFNVRKDAWAAWQAADSGSAFVAALAERGYRLARRGSDVYVVDPAGIDHRVTELIATASVKVGGGARVPAADVRARLADLINIPTIEEQQHEQEALVDDRRPVGQERDGQARPAGTRQQGIDLTDLRRTGDLGDGRAAGGGAVGAAAGGRATGSAGAVAGDADGDLRGPSPAGSESGRHRQSQLVAGRLEAARFARQLAVRPEAGRLRDLTARLRAGPSPETVERLAGQIERRRQPGRASIVYLPAPQDLHLVAEQRAAWIAKCIREEYDTGWLPSALVANIRRIDKRPDGITLTLKTGTRIIDRRDRIDVVGRVDDIAVGELVEAVRRRKEPSWVAVEITGTPAFRRAVAKGLLSLDPRIEVADNPLSDAEMAEIDARRPSRRAVAVPPAVVAPPLPTQPPTRPRTPTAWFLARLRGEGEPALVPMPPEES